MLVYLSILSDFPTQSVELNPKPIGSYWKHKSLNRSDKGNAW